MVGIDMKRGTITLPSVKQVLLVFAVCLIVAGIYDADIVLWLICLAILGLFFHFSGIHYGTIAMAVLGGITCIFIILYTILILVALVLEFKNEFFFFGILMFLFWLVTKKKREEKKAKERAGELAQQVARREAQRAHAENQEKERFELLKKQIKAGTKSRTSHSLGELSATIRKCERSQHLTRAETDPTMRKAYELEKELTAEHEKRKEEKAKKEKKAAEDKKKAALKALKEKLRRLKTAGLPNHITTDYLSLNLPDKEYAELFTFLRSEGAPKKSQSDHDILGEIDYHVFTGTVSKEDGLFLITHRSHIELMEPFRNKKLSKKKADEHAKNVRWLLIEMGFEDYPEAVKKVAAGADPEAVASLDGIRGNSPSRTKKSRGESKAKSPKVDEPDKEKESPRGRRKGRFSDD